MGRCQVGCSGQEVAVPGHVPGDVGTLRGSHISLKPPSRPAWSPRPLQQRWRVPPVLTSLTPLGMPSPVPAQVAREASGATSPGLWSLQGHPSLRWVDGKALCQEERLCPLGEQYWSSSPFLRH